MDINHLIDSLSDEETLMPVLFIGHGSPMNGIESNDFTKTWADFGKHIHTPKAVLCISAHWLTQGTAITAMPYPRTVHDFRGFPKELFEVKYPAPGSPYLAEQTKTLVKKANLSLDHEWGLDHGTWTVVRHMYPKANIPVLQLSIDYYKQGDYHYELAKELQTLRKRGVLIIGSGNMVHNLGMVAWDKMGEKSYGFDWAIEMNQLFKDKISIKDHASLIKYDQLNKAAKLAIPTPDHYWPLIYTLGASMPKDKISFFNDRLVAGSLTMTSVKFG